MHFNSEKFQCLRFESKHNDVPDYTYEAPGGVPIEVKDHLRDLGVELSSDLTFKAHISKTVTAASLTWLAGL